jgi:hypothetical protein
LKEGGKLIVYRMSEIHRKLCRLLELAEEVEHDEHVVTRPLVARSDALLSAQVQRKPSSAEHIAHNLPVELGGALGMPLRANHVMIDGGGPQFLTQTQEYKAVLQLVVLGCGGDPSCLRRPSQ